MVDTAAMVCPQNGPQLNVRNCVGWVFGGLMNQQLLKDRGDSMSAVFV